MKNHQIAQIFNDMAELLELKGENVFRIRAYRRASQNIDGLSRDVETLPEEELTKLPGIGKDLAGKVHEYLSTGKVAKYEELKKEIPSGVLEMLHVPGLGPKKAKQFFDKLKIKSVAELETAIRAGRLKGFPGVQAKTEENLLKSIEQVRRGSERRPLGRALPLAEDIVRRMQAAAPINRIEIAGSIRRWKETVKDIDILTTAKDPEAAMDAFVKLPLVGRVLSRGETKSSIVTDDGMQVDLRVVAEESFGAALAYFTGSKEHNIRLRERAVRAGLKINEYGVFKGAEEKRIGGNKEEDVYASLGLSWVPPEMREDRGEIELAQEHRLPELITIDDIRGDLHVHTRMSDGSHDLDAVVDAARKKGYAYIAITDHTQGLGVAHGLDQKRLAEQARMIDEANKRLTGFRVLKGTEVDIRSDGSLDLPDSVLAGLDIVVASIHSGFRQPRERITERLLAAIRNPVVSVIAHPTGRLIDERPAYDVDLEAVLREAAKQGVALEINSYPLRLDLTDQYAKLAGEYGVPIVINTDMHVTSQFDFMSYGVSVARRGWLEKKHVLNTLPLGQLLKRLGRSKKSL